jgi:hypothetical protein
MYRHIQELKNNPATENLGMKWSEEEINVLLIEIKTNIELEIIALNHKRTIGSIRGKLYNIAEHYINVKKININEVSKIVNIPVIKINEYLLKKLPKKQTTIIQEEPLDLQISFEEPKIIKLNIEQQNAIDCFKKGKNIFLTGPAGTGKSVTLKEIIKYCENNNIKFGVTATTGTAAFLISGKTLHSYLGIGLAKESAEDIFKYVRYKLKHVADKLRSLSILIIDEVSMLDLELFEKISEYLSYIRKNSKPFGGLQIILTGDFCQLEPVKGEFCFKSKVWDSLNLDIVYLHKLIRQDGDKDFQNILSKLRYGHCSERTYQKLLSLKNTTFGDVKPTKLYPRNVDVDKINKLEYEKLVSSGAEIKKYNIILPRLAKNKEKTEKWIKSLELSESVELCIGAQVILLANIDQESGLVNGTRGVIVQLKNKSIIIKRVSGVQHEISYYKTTNVEDESLSVQYMPLKLAYAMTHHKSQGMTLDAIEIDIGPKIFAAGQAYTALSRAKDLKSVKINAISKNSFIINKDVLEFYNKIENDLKDKNDKYIKSIINMVIYNLANHIELNNTLDFIWEFISGDDDETLDFFDEYNYEKLKLDYMEYEIKAEDDKINKLIKMVHNTKRYMLNDIDLVKDKLLEFELS